MNDSVFGIVITFLIVGVVLAIGVGYQSGIDLPSISLDEKKIPEVEQSEERLDNAYYDWCYKMKLECQ